MPRRRSSRYRGLATRAGLLLVALVSAGCDPGYGASAVNRSDTAIIIRDGFEKWDLPAHASGQIFTTLGVGKDAVPIDYEVLDAASCQILATQHVTFGSDDDPVIVVAADTTVALGSPGPSISEFLDPVSTDVCPGQADGWGLWILNDTAETFYVRTRSTHEVIVATVTPRSTAMAIGGDDETSTIELLDTECRVLDSHERSGWGPIEGTIDGTRLRLSPGVAPPDDIISYSYTDVCHE